MNIISIQPFLSFKKTRGMFILGKIGSQYSFSLQSVLTNIDSEGIDIMLQIIILCIFSLIKLPMLAQGPSHKINTVLSILGSRNSPSIAQCDKHSDKAQQRQNQLRCKQHIDQQEFAADSSHEQQDLKNVATKLSIIPNDQIDKITSNNKQTQESAETLNSQTQMPGCFQSLKATERLMIVIQHLIQKNKGRPLAQRMSNIQNIGSACNYNEIIQKFGDSDLLIVYQHQKLLINLWQTFHTLVKTPQYQMYNSVNFKEVMKEIYSLIDNEIDFVKLLMVLFKRRNVFLKEGTINENPFISHLIKDTQKLMVKSNLKSVAEQLLREIEKPTVSEEKPKTEAMNKDQSEDQQIFSYRMTRTVQLLGKNGFKSDKKYEHIIKDLAGFLIKLTDRHVEQILKQAVVLAEVSSKQPQDKSIPYDQYTYKPHRTHTKYTEKHQHEPQQAKLYKATYPNTMSLYKQLRLIECQKQIQLQQKLQPQIVFAKIKTGSHATKIQKAIHDYYHIVSSSQAISDLEQIQIQKAILPKKIALQPKHMRHILQNHQFYRRHIITWRVSNLY